MVKIDIDSPLFNQWIQDCIDKSRQDIGTMNATEYEEKWINGFAYPLMRFIDVQSD